MSATLDVTRRNRGRRLLLLIFAAFALPLVAAWALYLTRAHWSLGTVNHGELIQPVRPLTGLALQPLDGEVPGAVELRGKWTLVYVGSPDCREPCRASLYQMRQVRLALGEDMRRVQRLLILTGQDGIPALRDGLKEYPGMRVATATGRALEQVRDTFGADAQALYLVDPLGNLMMRYPAGADPKGMLNDLQRLLKLSRVG